MSNVDYGNRQAGAGSNNAPFMNGVNVTAKSSFAISAGAATITEIAISMLDGAGVLVADAMVMNVWLSDAATGAGLTGTTASGTVQAKATSGADFAALTAKKALVVQTLATGVYTLEITDTAKTGFYVCVQNPFTGQVTASRQLVTGDYGA